MNIQSMLEKDRRHSKSEPGAYEWWYFDAISEDGQTELVVIFYEGNPFSRRYINQLQKEGQARAEDFPAVSISIYNEGGPIYYSFTETENQAAFSEDDFEIQIDDHRLRASIKESEVVYHLDLSEKLPSGYSLRAELTYGGPVLSDAIDTLSLPGSRHCWNCMLPRAHVTGRIHCRAGTKIILSDTFQGRGYHDHNWGGEPLKNKFCNWYWGRFHFAAGTFIYYLEDGDRSYQKAWLISRGGHDLKQTFDDIELQDKSRSVFGLRPRRRILFKNEDASVLVQQHRLLDNGPFYQRYSSEAFLNIPGQHKIQQCRGITEYLNPPRIYRRLFWPLTNMRIRYKKENPHWVQRSRRLYRWTW